MKSSLETTDNENKALEGEIRGLNSEIAALSKKSQKAAKEVLDMENEIGKIAVGYSADMIAVASNPLDDIRTLEKVDWVMVRGRVIQ